jgi:hypothetical protein
MSYFLTTFASANDRREQSRRAIRAMERGFSEPGDEEAREIAAITDCYV